MLVSLPIALSLAGLDRRAGAAWGAGTRSAIAWAARAGWRAVALDATAPDARPRDLDGSARRDLGAHLRRNELAFAGCDLWIPPEHFTRPETMDRAIAAATGACELAGILQTLVGAGDRVITLTLPAEAADARAALRAAAERCGVGVADCRWPAADGAGDMIGLDPAAILLAGADPVAAAAAHGAEARAARLSDLSTAGRVAPGGSGGRLDVEAYLAALDVAGYRGHAVVDLRGVADQERAAASALDRLAQA
ncbi:MAG: hypothetical protein ACF8R7_06825 [Phycisphaerales bacterium JB039]